MNLSINLLALIALSCIQPLSAQNTVGFLSGVSDGVADGYNLFYPHNQSSTFLTDNCGRLVNVWEDDPEYSPGNAVYLMENGDLIRCKRDNDILSDPIWAGGGGEIVERRTWDNDLVWSYSLNNEDARLHHDVAPMPNGHVLMIAWERFSGDSARALGRDTGLLDDDELWMEMILEYDPVENEIVWEWHVSDHLVQNHSAEKPSFGNPADHPRRIDINYSPRNADADWLHANGIDYNAGLDHIVLSVPSFNELWIIDHSTTTEEARTGSGGNAGKGGDLLWRWGNNAAFLGEEHKEEQMLFFQHAPNWFGNSGTPAAGQDIIVFNNQINPDYSTVGVIDMEFEEENQEYPMLGNVFAPSDFKRVIMHPDTSAKSISGGLSSAQVQPNGNVLILSGRWGYAYEVNQQDELVWEYLIPLKNGQPVSQGEPVTINDNITFRMERYPADYPAFSIHEPVPGDYLELNPDTEFCQILSGLSDLQNRPLIALITPSHASDGLFRIQSEEPVHSVQVFDLKGRPISFHYTENSLDFSIDLSSHKPGMYILATQGRLIGRITRL